MISATGWKPIVKLITFFFYVTFVLTWHFSCLQLFTQCGSLQLQWPQLHLAAVVPSLMSPTTQGRRIDSQRIPSISHAVRPSFPLIVKTIHSKPFSEPLRCLLGHQQYELLGSQKFHFFIDGIWYIRNDMSNLYLFPQFQTHESSLYFQLIRQLVRTMNPMDISLFPLFTTQ